MTHYTLLAHNQNGREALVQHDDQPNAYLYFYTFPQRWVDMLPHQRNYFSRIAKSLFQPTTYTLVPLDYTVDPQMWVTDYPLGGNHFNNSNEIYQYLLGYLGGMG